MCGFWYCFLVVCVFHSCCIKLQPEVSIHQKKNTNKKPRKKSTECCFWTAPALELSELSYEGWPSTACFPQPRLSGILRRVSDLL